MSWPQLNTPPATPINDMTAMCWLIKNGNMDHVGITCSHLDKSDSFLSIPSPEHQLPNHRPVLALKVADVWGGPGGLESPPPSLLNNLHDQCVHHVSSWDIKEKINEAFTA
jgi:hypothetical protein